MLCRGVSRSRNDNESVRPAFACHKRGTREGCRPTRHSRDVRGAKRHTFTLVKIAYDLCALSEDRFAVIKDPVRAVDRFV